MGGFPAQLTNGLASLMPSPALLNQHQFAEIWHDPLINFELAIWFGIQSGLKTSYRPQSGAQNSWVLWNNKQQLPAYFIMYILHMRKCQTLVVYCDADCIGMLCTVYSLQML